MFFEDSDDGVDDFATDGHLIGIEISGSLRCFHLKFKLGRRFFFFCFWFDCFVLLGFLLYAERIFVFEQERDLIFGFAEESLRI